MFIYKSDPTPVDPNFVIKAFLDTNILVFLVDNTYIRLTDAISYMNECKFIEHVSSSYAIFEFIGVRKKEHYLRSILLKSLTVDNGSVNVENFNLSALLKYKDTFTSEDVIFADIKASLKVKVEEDLARIVNDFGVEYSNHKFHSNLFEPTKELFLDTLISKEDCFVMCSAVWPDNYTNDNSMMFLTNDKQFFTSFSQTVEEDFFTSRSAKTPEVLYVKKFGSLGGSLPDLTSSTTAFDTVIPVIENLVKNYAINNNYFLGYTRSSPKNFPDIICFTLDAGKELKGNIYLTIISKELNFYYNTNVMINSYMHNGININLPYTNSTSTVNLCFSIDTMAEGLNNEFNGTKAIDLLRTPGNLVFVLPDSHKFQYSQTQ